jgi:hypothetical protein
MFFSMKLSVANVALWWLTVNSEVFCSGIHGLTPYADKGWSKAAEISGLMAGW